MLLSRKIKIKLNSEQEIFIYHMNYAARKLWNVLNYERRNYKTLGLKEYPDWYYQKKIHKNNIWYKSLPSQTAQEVCKILDCAWKSYYSLLKTKGIENPNPPRFKSDNIPITYMQKGFVYDKENGVIRLSLPKQLKSHMAERFKIYANFLFLENKLFQDIDHIKQIKLYPPKDSMCEAIIVYEIPDVKLLPDNGKYLSIDLGIHNFMTCFNSVNGETFIVGRKYFSICRYYDKEIGHVQSVWYSIQNKKGIKYPKSSAKINKLYERKKNAINDYLHKMTKSIVNYCIVNNINTVVIGDITGIRENRSLGGKTNQKFHSLPYKKIVDMLRYKLAMKGINRVMQIESYSSQTSPLAPKVSKKYAEPKKRIKRGLYVDNEYTWNADTVGAYNILRLYLKGNELKIKGTDIKIPYILKVAA